MQSHGTTKTRRGEGIVLRHSRECAVELERAAARRDGRPVDPVVCDCSPTFRAQVFDRATKTKVRKSFTSLAEAKRWRTSTAAKQIAGKTITRSNRTLRQAVEEWLAGASAEPPTVLAGGAHGVPYKPSTLREYERNLRPAVEELGAHRVADIRRGNVQRLIDRLVGEGRSASKVRNVAVALQSVLSYEVSRHGLEANPASGLDLPAAGQGRQRAASVAEATRLIAALPTDLRALYATAAFAGLRRGELRGLRWNDVDLAGGKIHVRRGWDDKAGPIATKSRAGTRMVPVPAILRDELVEHKSRTGRSGDDLVFGVTGTNPFTPGIVSKRALESWAATAVGAFLAGRSSSLEPITLHELRHSFVSFWHEAGLSLEEIAPYAGHSSAWMTERYRHLIEGHDDRVRDRVDAYFARADTTARIVQIDED